MAGRDLPGRVPGPEAQAGALPAHAEQGRVRKRRAWAAVLVIALVVLFAALAALGVLWYSYFQGQQKYDAAERLASAEGLAEGRLANFDDVNRVQVDWDALAQANPDTVAWVYMPGTVISYPVVQGQDNYYYLTRDFDGDAGWLANYGSIFMDWQNAPNWSDESYFIYGHHMNDGSMFAELVALEDQERFDSHRTVYLLSPHGNFKLRSYALVHCSPDDPIVMSGFDDAEQRTGYVQDKMDRSVVEVADAPAAADIGKSFAFATCDNASWGRYVLYCYVEQANAEGLAGAAGIEQAPDGPVGFSDTIGNDGQS